jgi:hypothetical protein
MGYEAVGALRHGWAAAVWWARAGGAHCGARARHR